MMPKESINTLIISARVDKTSRRIINECLASQGRFRHLEEEEVEKMQKWLDEDWQQLQSLASSNESYPMADGRRKNTSMQ